MTNNEKFNALLNATSDPRRTYDSLMALAAGTGEERHKENKQNAISLEDLMICTLAKSLDSVQFAALLATLQALAAGMEPVAALAAGNVVLVSAGYPPAPVYIPEGG